MKARAVKAIYLNFRYSFYTDFLITKLVTEQLGVWTIRYGENWLDCQAECARHKVQLAASSKWLLSGIC